ncbi:MAG: hypothetical protein JWQ19_1527 [Subtercola sp.]|nr:hypothetical protein [Subtercola sp.]
MKLAVASIVTVGVVTIVLAGQVGAQASQLGASSVVGESSITSAGAQNSSLSEIEAQFRAVYFLQGPSAPALYQNSFVDETDDFASVATAADTPGAFEVVSTLMSQIEASDPQFMPAWSRDISSGDPYVVKQAMIRGNKAMASTKFATDAVASSKQTYIPGDGGTECGAVVVVGAAFVIAAGVFVVVGAVGIDAAAVGYNVVLAENAVWVRIVAPKGDPTDEWVALVSERLAP